MKQDIACFRVNRLRQRIVSVWRAGKKRELVDTLNSLSENDFKNQWGILRRVLFDAIGLHELICIDQNPIDLIASASSNIESTFLSQIEATAIDALRKQVAQENTFFIDTERLAQTQAAFLIPDIASTRIEELRKVCSNDFSPSAFVQTYYGFKLTTARVRNRDFGGKVAEALKELGIKSLSEIRVTDFDFKPLSIEFARVSARTQRLLRNILRLTGNNSGERAKAAENLGTIGDPRVEPYLRAATKDEYPWVKKAAIEALRQMRLPSSINTLVECLYDLESTVRTEAANAIACFGDRAIPHLVDVLEHDQEIHYESALEEAKGFHPRSLDSFAAALLHRDSEAKRLARSVLDDLGYSAPSAE